MEEETIVKRQVLPLESRSSASSGMCQKYLNFNIVLQQLFEILLNMICVLDVEVYHVISTILQIPKILFLQVFQTFNKHYIGY